MLCFILFIFFLIILSKAENVYNGEIVHDFESLRIKYVPPPHFRIVSLSENHLQICVNGFSERCVFFYRSFSTSTVYVHMCVFFFFGCYFVVFVRHTGVLVLCVPFSDFSVFLFGWNTLIRVAWNDFKFTYLLCGFVRGEGISV